MDAAVALASRRRALLPAVVGSWLELEEDLGLFGLRIAGCPFWERIRVDAHQLLLQKLGGLPPPQDPPDRRPRRWLAATPGIVDSVLHHNPFLAPSPEVLFIGHSRRVQRDDGCWWDLYCDPIALSLDRSSLLLERSFHLEHRAPARTPRLAHLDLPHLIAAVRSRLFAGTLSAAERRLLAEVEEEIRDRWKVDIPIAVLAERAVNRRRGELPVYRSLLRELRPKVIFLVVGYGNEGIIEAARHEGIPTAELQHGVISRYHLGYSFPGEGCRKQDFADFLLTFGSLWEEAACYPIPRERVVSVGFPYLEQTRAAHPPRREAASILFLSQRGVGEALSRQAVKVARDATVHGPVIYKLHPGERRSWRRDYPWLEASGVHIIEGESPHLYELFAGARAQVGVYSTALLEGLAYPLQTLLVDLPGVEHLERVVGRAAGVVRVADGEELIDALRQPSPHESFGDIDEIFRPGALANIRGFLDDIL